jgi:Spy/CpxP family protein refolding chaperone
MKNLFFILFFCGLHAVVVAQPVPNADKPKTQQPPGEGKMRALVIAYITRELDLTPELAQKFWPVYNAYEKEIRAARKQYASDELVLEENLLTIRKNYKTKFIATGLTEEKVNKLYKLEKVIVQKIRETLKKRAAQRRGNTPT